MESFLLEIYSEEIPATIQNSMLEKLSTIMNDAMRKHCLLDSDHALSSDISPCRIMFMTTNMRTDMSASFIRGPKCDASSAAINGFARKHSIDVCQLQVEHDYYIYKISDMKEHLANIVLAAMHKMAASWPKRMRWNETNKEWIRPIRSFVCLLNEEVIDFEFGGVKSGRITYGNKNITNCAKIAIDKPCNYLSLLERNFVLMSSQRYDKIVKEIKILQTKYNFICDYNELILEVANLCEYPLVLMGHIDLEYMHIPSCILIKTMTSHQRYFTVRDNCDRLLPNFLFIAESSGNNIETITSGHQKVLSARLADAKFFFDKDKEKFSKQFVASDIKDILSNIPFNSKLGNMEQRVMRLEKMAEQLCIATGSKLVYRKKIHASKCHEQYNEKQFFNNLSLNIDDLQIKDLYKKWEQIAQKEVVESGNSAIITEFVQHITTDNISLIKEQLKTAIQYSKIDLATSVVAEFPELQGIIGSIYAQQFWNLEKPVADAIEWQYSQCSMEMVSNEECYETCEQINASIPRLLLAIIDRIEYIACHFYLNHRPTSSGDPFALRRARNKICQIATQDWSFNIIINLPLVASLLQKILPEPFTQLAEELCTFINSGFKEIKSPLLAVHEISAIQDIKALADIIYHPVVQNYWIFAIKIIAPLYSRLISITNIDTHDTDAVANDVISDYDNEEASNDIISDYANDEHLEQKYIRLLKSDAISTMHDNKNCVEMNLTNEIISCAKSLIGKRLDIHYTIKTCMHLSRLLDQYLATHIIEHKQKNIRTRRLSLLKELSSLLVSEFEFLPLII